MPDSQFEMHCKREVQELLAEGELKVACEECGGRGEDFPRWTGFIGFVCDSCNGEGWKRSFP